MSWCIACLAGFPRECRNPDGVCGEDEVLVIKQRGGPLKANEDVTDPKSTGRKRAAVLLPLKDENDEPFICAWEGLKYAGGGQNPIVGCLGNPATNRHHGPDKDTLNNDAIGVNLHRICTYCHNRWHGKNDATYAAYITEIGGLDKIQAHDAETRASQEELYRQATPPELLAFSKRGILQ